MSRAAPLAALLLPLALAACSTRLREEPPTERCGDVMRQAFPGGEIEVNRTSVVPVATQSIATIVVAAEGTRRDIKPGDVLLREVAVECRFNDGILTGFRWTKGPLR